MNQAEMILLRRAAARVTGAQAAVASNDHDAANVALNEALDALGELVSRDPHLARLNIPANLNRSEVQRS